MMGMLGNLTDLTEALRESTDRIVGKLDRLDRIEGLLSDLIDELRARSR